MNRKHYAELAAAAIAASPLPDSFDDLDAASRRHLARQAEAQGVTPEGHYAALRAAAEASAADDAIVAEVLALTRR